MDVLLDTEFRFGCISGRVSFPKHSLTMVIKATFDLLPGECATLIEEQPVPGGDEPYEDDEEGLGSQRYEMDFAHLKPRADLMLVGSCYPPRRPAKTAQATFAVGRTSKTLSILGDRGTMTDPETFESMPLRYERAARSKKNPVGTKNPPNIEDPKNRNEPAGFAPLSRMWKTRFDKTGNYKGKYVEERWPWYPKDFDYGFYNAAHPDLQVEGYLRGDEEVRLENLHPEHPVVRCKLPGLRPRCFVIDHPLPAPEADHEGAEPRRGAFREVKLNLDTLWIDADNLTLVLVWRGVTPVASEEYEDIATTYVFHEKLEDESPSIASCEERFYKRLAELEAPEEFEPEEPPSPGVDWAAIKAEAEKEIAAAKEQMIENLKAAGLDPDNLPEPSEEMTRIEADMVEQLGDGGYDDPPAPTREWVIERAASGEGLAEEDLSDLDLSRLELRGVDFTEATLSGANLEGTDLSGATLIGALLEGTALPGAKLVEADLTDADFTGAKMGSADLSRAKLDDAVFEGADLGGATLDEVAATDCIFAEANLEGASLKKADLSGADFGHATISEASFVGATMREASVEGATGLRVDMSEADLTELRASEACNLSFGKFKMAVAPDSTWEDAQLVQAEFASAKMPRADFTGANLDEAVFIGADCTGARFAKARLRAAKMSFANLFESNFEKADLTQTDFQGSNLFASEFLDATLVRTSFKQANIKLTKVADR